MESNPEGLGTHVTIPWPLWHRIAKLLDYAEQVRSTPENWPLSPSEMAIQVRKLHLDLKAISDSKDFLEIKLITALGEYVRHLKKQA